MDIVTFDQEKFMDKIRLNLPVFIVGFLIIATATYNKISQDRILTMDVYSQSGYLLGLLAILFIAVTIFVVSLKMKYGRNVLKLSVNVHDLTFTIDGDTYDFSDLLPNYDMSIAGIPHFMSWYNFTIYLKSGASLNFSLTQSVALSFMNYLNKYARINSKTML